MTKAGDMYPKLECIIVIFCLYSIVKDEFGEFGNLLSMCSPSGLCVREKEQFLNITDTELE